MFKPNYNQNRAERRRAQQAKQEKKLKEQQEVVAARRAARAALNPDNKPAGSVSGDTDGGDGN